jgi:uncharacterized membrane protein YoaT (DUF817 family)
MKYVNNQFFKELFIFIKKQARASVFGGVLLFVIIITKWINFNDFLLTRYDVIFLMAIFIQFILLITKMETVRELKVIFSFHFLAMVMELFKTNPMIGSWRYPDQPGIFMLATVPLFTGFLYSSVGSYIARAWRIFDLHFTYFPKFKYLSLFSLCAYLNFFTHHYIWDIRWVLFLMVIVIFHKTIVHFTMIKTPRSMPLIFGFLLISFFLYVAENVGTYMKVWLYPNQTIDWQLVRFGKFGSWFLLIIISFTLVAFIYRGNIFRNDKSTR